MKQEIIDGILGVKSVYPDARFVVFGSEARNTATQNSDVDICVIFPEIEKDPFILASEIAVDVRKYLL